MYNEQKMFQPLFKRHLFSFQYINYIFFQTCSEKDRIKKQFSFSPDISSVFR